MTKQEQLKLLEYESSLKKEFPDLDVFTIVNSKEEVAILNNQGNRNDKDVKEIAFRLLRNMDEKEFINLYMDIQKKKLKNAEIRRLDEGELTNEEFDDWAAKTKAFLNFGLAIFDDPKIVTIVTSDLNKKSGVLSSIPAKEALFYLIEAITQIAESEKERTDKEEDFLKQIKSIINE